MRATVRRLLLRSGGVLLAFLAAAPADAAAPLCQRAGDLGRVVLACWMPPAGGGAVTVSLSLRRDGTVIGVPRVTFVQPGDRAGDPSEGGRALAASVVAAVARCTPVRLSPALQAVLPGQILRIRFTAAPGSKSVSTVWSGT